MGGMRVEPTIELNATPGCLSELRAANAPCISFFFHPAIALLWDSYHLAEDLLGSEPDERIWDVALEIDRLRELGMDETHLRWMALKGYVECKHETNGTNSEAAGSCANRIRFEDDTLLVLTRPGFEVLQQLSRALSEGHLAQTFPNPIARSNGRSSALATSPDLVPRWDYSLRELWVGSCLVKRFKGRADNQALVLCAFEEEKWAVRIDDPLPPHPQLDSKLRLRDTISSLNRHQSMPRIRFHGDGTGRGVRWEPLE